MITNQIQAATRFAHCFADGSVRLRRCLKARLPSGELPEEAVRDTLVHWGQSAVKILDIDLEVKGKPSQSPVLLVGNHISYVDIPILMSQASIMFVAKREVGAWPVFGTAVRKLGMVLVDRKSPDSRQQAQEAVADCILKRKRHVAIFPSGTTCLEEKKPWRWGAFQIAERYGIAIQPFRVRYEPARVAAYLMEDVFAPHLWKLLQQPRLKAWLEFSDPIQVTDPGAEAERWRVWSRPTAQ